MEDRNKKVSPKLIYDEVCKTVVGQDAAKKMIANVAFLHMVRYGQCLKEGKVLRKNNALLMGPTGTGKTFIVRETARALRKLTGLPLCPVLELDCTELSPRGWVGDSISELLNEHYDKNRDNMDAFNTTIVFLDEFDKICKPAISSSGTDHNRNTQYNLLKFIEGADLRGDKAHGPKNTVIGTYHMLFVMAGNFSEVRRARATKAELKDKTLGFGLAPEKDVDAEFVDMHTELDKAGMATQLVGRTPFIGELTELQPTELRKILDDHLIPEYATTWKYLGKKLKVEEDAKEKIIQDCFRRKTGARGLQADLAKVLEDDIFNTEVRL